MKAPTKLTLLIIFLFTNISISFSQYWLSNFQYRIPITIIERSGNNLIDYQVLITVNTQSLISQNKMRSDCGDIRFTDSDGITLLPYWIESGCNSANTRIWIKVNLTANSNKTIYMYYGNSLATSMSDISNVFIWMLRETFPSITNSTWGSGQSNPEDTFNTYFHDARNEILIRATDFQGFAPINITQIIIYVNQQPGRDLDNYRVRYQLTERTSLTNTFTTTGWILVFGPTNLGRPIAGTVITLNLNPNILWTNHSLNLLLDLSRDTTSYVSGGGMYRKLVGIANTMCTYYSNSARAWPFDGICTLRNYIPSLIFVGWFRKYTSLEPLISIGREEIITVPIWLHYSSNKSQSLINEPILFSSLWNASNSTLYLRLTNWLSNFQYRIPITIIERSGNNLIDYQVLITVNTQSLISQNKMRSDCGDIRFTDSDGITLLPYWIESGCNSANTRIWIKVNLTANSNKTIYMYYGNSLATSISNGDLVFELFDDFRFSSTINTNKWIISRYSNDVNNECIISSGILWLTTKSTWKGCNILARNFNIKYNSQYTIHVKFKIDYVCGTSNDGDGMAIVIDGNSSSVSNGCKKGFSTTNQGIVIEIFDDRINEDNGIGIDDETDYCVLEGRITSSIPQKSYDLNDGLIEIKLNGTHINVTYYDLNPANGYLIRNLITNVWNPNGNGYFMIGAGTGCSDCDESDACDNSDSAHGIEYVFARKYAPIEPSISLGSEEVYFVVTPQNLWLSHYIFSYTLNNNPWINETYRFNISQQYWLSNFQYRIPITIIERSGNNLIDYQVLITVNTQSLISQNKMRSDCGDIRFTDSDGITLLPYWIESGCNSANTRIWIKVNLTANSNKTIYMYYGNSLATSMSDGKNVFVFFEDFETTLIGWSLSGKWHTTNYGVNSIILRYGNPNTDSYDGGTNAGDAISPSFILPSGCILTYRDKSATEYSGFNSDPYYDREEIYISLDNGNTWILLSIYSGTWDWMIRNIDISFYSSQSTRIRFSFNTVDSIANNFYGWAIDNIIIRRYVSPEPLISLRREETILTSLFTAWANITKSFSQPGTLCWRFYANNSLNLWNATPISCINIISPDFWLEVKLTSPRENSITNLIIGEGMQISANVTMRSSFSFCISGNSALRYNVTSLSPNSPVPITDSISVDNNPKYFSICTNNSTHVNFIITANNPTLRILDVLFCSSNICNDTLDFYINVSLVATRDFTLRTGWNLISIPYKNIYFDLNNDGCNIREKIFHYYNASTNSWKYFRYNELIPGIAYWVYSEKDCITKAAISGNLNFSDLPKTIKNRKNYIGSLTDIVSINSVANVINCSNPIVRYWNPILNSFIDATQIIPWYGYIWECS